MRHQKKTDKLGRKTPHRQATLSNLVASLIDHERVTTTLRLAKSARRYADRMVTLAKKDTLHSRRQAISFLRPSGDDRKETVRKLFSDVGPRYAERPGGYTRIYQIGNRRGDNAPMAILELVDAKLTPKERTKTRDEEPELLVETEVSGEIQSQAEAAEERTEEQPAAVSEPEKAAVDLRPAEAEGEAETKVKEEKPKEAKSAAETEEESEELKDKKGGMGRFLKGLFGKEQE